MLYARHARQQPGREEDLMDVLKNAQLEKCVDFARKAHAGQKDKGGHDYIEHPLRLMDAVTSPEEKIVAILHDVLEDTCYTAGDLKKLLGISDEIVDALKLLTRKRGENYMEYIRKLSDNPLAVAVKLADLKDNMNLDRLKQVTQDDLKRCEKYREAYAYLNER